MEINNKIKVIDFLDTLISIEKVSQYALGESLKLFGGRNTVIQLLFNFFIAEPDKLEDDNYSNIYKSILFDCSLNQTYIDDWDEVWYLVKDLPLKFIVNALEEYPPGKKSIQGEDRALMYLLNNYYNCNYLTKDIYNELKSLFESEPINFKKFRKQEQFKIKILEFRDLEWLKENYSEFSFDRDEILSLLKQVIINNRLDNLMKFSLFIDIVRFFAPFNTINKRYRDAFILEIFEGIWGIEVIDEEGDEEKYNLLVENFPEIDFESDNSKDIKDNIDIVCKEEADHITKHLQNNQNYRHD